MANSITLSTALVSDIQAKIDAGTATAEEVVLYTKGLNQLQTGNDFQSVVIGLSQSAVDAIDSSNAQFQEDSQTALSTFSQTATNINTSATNAVSAINTAKDALVATDAEITTTINSLPTKTSVEESVKWVVKQTDEYTNSNDTPNWDGVHPLPKKIKPYNPGYPERVVDHPWKAPAMIWVGRRGYSSYDSEITLLDHEYQIIDMVGVDNSDIQYTTAAQTNITHNLMPNARYQYWEMIHNYGIYATEDTAATGDKNNPGMTGYMNHYGVGRHMHSPYAHRGLAPGNFLASSNITGGSDRVHYGGSITNVVGSGDNLHRDYLISRPYNDNRIYLSATVAGNFATFSRNIRPNRRNETDFWTATHSWKTQQNWGKYHDSIAPGSSYPGDEQFHDRLRFTTYHASGYGLTSYNTNTGKFAFIATEAGGTTYNWNAKLFTVNSTKKLRDIALGRVEISAVDADAVSEGVMTLAIDSTLDFKTESQVTQAAANYSTYDRYHGHVVLCDNDSMVIGTPYNSSGTNVGTAYRRIVKNGTGNEYTYDTMKWWPGNTPYSSADYGGMVVSVSNDGRYAIMYDSYYYYGSGINAVLIRVADGAMLPFTYGDTARGFNVIPLKHDKFLLDRQYASNTYNQYIVDCDYLFSIHADMTDISSYIFNTTDHHEYDYVRMFSSNNMRNKYYTMSGTMVPIYNPYNYLMHYYNADGTRKSQYDRNLNLIS